jgi:hypothetical protein
VCRGGRASRGGRSGPRGFVARSEGEGEREEIFSEEEMTQIHIDGDFEHGDEIEV